MWGFAQLSSFALLLEVNWYCSIFDLVTISILVYLVYWSLLNKYC